MIDYSMLSAANARSEPFSYAVLPDLVPPGQAAVLAGEFPVEGFHLDERSAGDGGKAYRSYNLNIVVENERVSSSWEHLSPVWRQLLSVLAGREYLAALSSAMAVQVDDCALEIRLCRYEQGCWIEPHTDRLDKRLTQTIYFTPGWQSSWGGNLVILRSADIGDTAATVSPGLGNSVILVPSEASWHAVQPVSGGAHAHRRS